MHLCVRLQACRKTGGCAEAPSAGHRGRSPEKDLTLFARQLALQKFPRHFRTPATLFLIHAHAPIAPCQLSNAFQLREFRRGADAVYATETAQVRRQQTIQRPKSAAISLLPTSPAYTGDAPVRKTPATPRRAGEAMPDLSIFHAVIIRPTYPIRAPPFKEAAWHSAEDRLILFLRSASQKWSAGKDTTYVEIVIK